MFLWHAFGSSQAEPHNGDSLGRAGEGHAARRLQILTLVASLLLSGCGSGVAGSGGAGLPAAVPTSMPTTGPVQEPTVARSGANTAGSAQATVVVRAVEADLEVRTLMRTLEQAGVVPQPSDVSRFELLSDTAGQSYTLTNGEAVEYLFVHPFGSVEAATQRSEQLRRSIASNPNRPIDWVAPPRFFQCRSVIAVYLGRSASTEQALTKACGIPFATIDK